MAKFAACERRTDLEDGGIRLCRNKLKRLWERTDPWRTHFGNYAVIYRLLLFIWAWQLERKFANHFLLWLCTAMFRILPISIWQGTVLPAFLTSIVGVLCKSMVVFY